MKCSTAEVASTSIRKRTPVYGRRTVIRLTSYSIRTGFSVWRIFNTYADALCMYNRSRPQKVGRRKSADYRSQRRVLPPIHRVQDRCRLLSNLGEQPEIKVPAMNELLQIFMPALIALFCTCWIYPYILKVAK